MTSYTPGAMRAGERIVDSVLPPEDVCRRPGTMKALAAAAATIITEETGDGDLLAALSKARGYVMSMHTNIAKALGHENTIIKPDLDMIDAAITRARGQEDSTS